MLVEQTKLVDPTTRLPIVVVDTSSLNGTLPDEHLLRKSIKSLPATEYALIFFASHSPKVTLQWLQRANKLIDRDARKRVQRIYLVHETFLYRTLQKALGNIVSPKFSKKLVYLKSLSELARYCDITLLNISREIYVHNLRVESHIIIPKQSQPIYGFPVEVGYDFFPQILDFLYVAPLTAKSFEKTGGSETVWTLKQAFDRNQTIDLTEYGPQLVIAAFKLYLYELPVPLVSISDIPLPLQETAEYWNSLDSLPAWPELLLIGEFLQHATRVYHIDSNLVAASFGPAICALINPSKDDLMVCTRFTRLLATGTDAFTRPGRSRSRSPVHIKQVSQSSHGLGLAPTLIPDAVRAPKPPLSRSPSPTARSVSASSASTGASSIQPCLEPKRTASMPASPPKPTLVKPSLPPVASPAPKPTAFRRPSNATPPSPLKEKTNMSAPREQVTLKPVPLKERTLKPKPSLQSINGKKPRVGDIAQFYESMSI